MGIAGFFKRLFHAPTVSKSEQSLVCSVSMMNGNGCDFRSINGAVGASFSAVVTARANIGEDTSDDSRCVELSGYILNRLISIDGSVQLHDIAFDADCEYKRRFAQDTSGSGCAVAAVYIKDGELFWLSAGNLRIYLFRDNNLVCLTRCHTQGAARMMRAVEDNAKIETAVLPGDSMVTSCLGALTEIDRNIKPFHLKRSDRILICEVETEIAAAPNELNSDTLLGLLKDRIDVKNPIKAILIDL